MTKNQTEYDNGLITVLLDRYKNQRLPTALDIKEKVESGEELNEFDLMFLKEVSKDISDNSQLLDRHPECKELATQMMNLCSDIAKKGLDNEK